jgi:isochorismate synthase
VSRDRASAATADPSDDPSAQPPGSGPALVARTWPVDGDVDLVAVAGEHGHLWTRGDVGFAGRGRALSIEVPPGDPAAAGSAVQDALARIRRVEGADDDQGRGPVAMGALPFDPSQPGTLVVPSVLVERDPAGATWVTSVGPADVGSGASPAPPVLASEEPHGPDPTRFTVTSPRPPEEWTAALVAARSELRAGRAAKVVLARELVIETDRPLSRRAVLEQLRRAYPTAMAFAADGFVGASPELLVERDGQLVRSHPMAGTAPRHADPARDAALAAELVASTKNMGEHRFTIDMVHDTLLPWCSYLDEEAEPSIVAMANVQHLATRVEGRLSSPPASVIELMRALHPTPAVNGVPGATALELIDQYEGFDRGCYGGPVGWVDAAGNGAWTVGIRSAEIEGCQARLFAGVGVVADSDPAAELAETRVKFEAVLNAILRP